MKIGPRLAQTPAKLVLIIMVISIESANLGSCDHDNPIKNNKTPENNPINAAVDNSFPKALKILLSVIKFEANALIVDVLDKSPILPLIDVNTGRKLVINICCFNKS